MNYLTDERRQKLEKMLEGTEDRCTEFREGFLCGQIELLRADLFLCESEAEALTLAARKYLQKNG